MLQTAVAHPGTECCKLQWLTQAQSAASCTGSPWHRVLRAALAHPGTECCELHWLTQAQSAASCTGSPRHRVLRAALAHPGTECCKLHWLTQAQSAASCTGSPRYRVLRAALAHPGTECCKLHWLTLAQSAASCKGSPSHRTLQTATAHPGTIRPLLFFAGTICDDGWNNQAARVACRQLQHTTGSVKFTSRPVRKAAGSTQPLCPPLHPAQPSFGDLHNPTGHYTQWTLQGGV